MILILKHKWYDMIASGEKREEYRDYHVRRNWRIADRLLQMMPPERVVELRRGYTKTYLFAHVVDVGVAECAVSRSALREDGFEMRPEWGFDRSVKTIVFRLGRIVKGGQG